MRWFLKNELHAATISLHSLRNLIIIACYVTYNMAREGCLAGKAQTKVLFEFDLSFSGAVIGCDEAGRGPLAGPVVCAACIMPLEHMIDGINDSKLVSEGKREVLYEEIIKKAVCFKVCMVDQTEIDRINILEATKRGMCEAVGGVCKELIGLKNGSSAGGVVLVDAVSLDLEDAGLGVGGLDLKMHAIVKGDAKSYNIAAASIIAKVTRDRIMRELDLRFPQYHFKSNKGYGTGEHIAALKEFGACEFHRKTFIKKFVDAAGS